MTAIGSSGMNSKTESFQHLFEQNQSESPNDINKIKVSDLGSDLEKIPIDSDFERERSGKMRTLASAGIATLGCSRTFFQILGIRPKLKLLPGMYC